MKRLADEIEEVADKIFNQNALRSRQLSDIASRVAMIETALAGVAEKQVGARPEERGIPMDTVRLDFLLNLAGPTIQEQFEFKRHDPSTNANHYVWHKDKDPRSVHLYRTLNGVWTLEQCNGKDFEDFEMVELAEGTDLRAVIDTAIGFPEPPSPPQRDSSGDPK